MFKKITRLGDVVFQQSNDFNYLLRYKYNYSHNSEGGCGQVFLVRKSICYVMIQ